MNIDKHGVVTFTIQPHDCAVCGHKHGGPDVAYICVGCPCPERPGAPPSSDWYDGEPKRCPGSGRFSRRRYMGEVDEKNQKILVASCDWCGIEYRHDVEMPEHTFIPVRAEDITFGDSRVMYGIEPGMEDIKIDPDPDLPGRVHVTMPAPVATQAELDAIRHTVRGAVTEEVAALIRCDGDHPIPRCPDPQCWHRDPRAGDVKAPHIVVLCGSTRFFDHFLRANFEETLKGNVVLSEHFMLRRHGEDVGVTPAEKLRLDELHKRKIDLADEVIVLNVGGYIGKSTASEIEYAEQHGKPIRWLEPPQDLCGYCGHPIGALPAINGWHLACAETSWRAQSEER